MAAMIFGAFFFMVPLTFILTFVFPDIINLMIVPLGLTFAAIVFVADCVRKKVFTKGQLLKMFLNSLLLIKFFILYEMKICMYIAMVSSIILVLALMVLLANGYDKMVNECLSSDEMNAS